MSLEIIVFFNPTRYKITVKKINSINPILQKCRLRQLCTPLFPTAQLLMKCKRPSSKP